MIKKIIKKIVPKFLIGWYHYVLAFLGALVYGFPSRKITVIGVTGTHGKTTVVNLATAILEGVGYKVAATSSIKFRIAGQEEENKLKMTMPGRARLQKFLRDAVKAGCQYAILEVTSEGVLQYRHKFITFKTMVFTNLFKEHLERHGGFENYKKAKGEYFKACKNIHIINTDDAQADYFMQFPAKQKIMFGKSPSAQVRVENVEVLDKGIKFDVIYGVQKEQINLSLMGKFNVYNSLAAISIALVEGASLLPCKQVLEQVKGVSGRMEEVISGPFKVVIDYAFTPDALTQVYQSLKPNSESGKGLICVLGACGGGRDKWKRPELGKIAGQYCKHVIVTNEDPYDEDPLEIIDQVADGVGEKAKKILDRREAISQALRLAQEGDTVIITGKGCEPQIMEANGRQTPWDDRRITREEFAKNLT